MAPTLLGNHREIDLPELRAPRSSSGSMTDGRPARRSARIAARGPRRRPAIECSGDRVLVQKFLYEFRRPRRWEVAVFHFPGEPSQAYVKRVVGLPGESIQIVDGRRVHRRPDRPQVAAEVRAMRILVYDNDFQPRDSDRFPRWVFRRAARRTRRSSGWPAEANRFVHERPPTVAALADRLARVPATGSRPGRLRAGLRFLSLQRRRACAANNGSTTWM